MENLEDDENITVRFVIPEGESETSVSGAMHQAFDLCQEKMSEVRAEYVRAEEVLRLSPTKTDVFVLDEFSGPVFEHLTKGDKFKCTVIGPRCLTSCLLTNTHVPNLPYPMYSIVMHGLNVTCSGLTREEKAEVKSLVERMAGVYSADFHDGVTHLVSGNVTSEKYKVAMSTGTAVMTKEWVKQLWKSCQRDNIKASDQRFLKYKCPVFFGLTVTVSQLSKQDKALLKKKIESHGGSYMGELTMDGTNVLICMTADGNKYDYATKWKIPCLKPDWIYHSVDKGYALAQDEYRVTKKSNKVSTPTKTDTTVTGLEDVSMCSTILNPDDSAVVSRVDDTVNSSVMGVLSVEQLGKTTEDWLAELDLSKVKKAGHFLDNLKIYLSGFSEKDQVLMTRVLKYAGATRLTQLVDSVTHVVHAITRTVDPETTRILKDLGINPLSVSVEWIVESMKRGTRVPEKEYTFPPLDSQANRTFRSPEQAAGTSAVSRPQSAPVSAAASSADASPAKDDSILDQYKENKTGVEDATLTQETSTQILPFFANLKFELCGLNEELEQELSEWIHEVGGDVVFSDYKGVVDYLITPIQGAQSKLTARNHLNYLWVEDCLDNTKIVDVVYYHLPITRKMTEAPLCGAVTCVSGYANKERLYINTVVEILGGNPQEMFAKKDNSAKAVSASTHLFCPQGEGQKYKAALKWGLPVITKDWLVACLKEWKWISEKPFLVGSATAFTKDKPLPAPVQEDDLEDMEANDDSTILQDVDLNQSNSSSSRRRSSRGSRASLSKSVETSSKAGSKRRSSSSLSPEHALKQATTDVKSAAVGMDPGSKMETAESPSLSSREMEVDTPVTARKVCKKKENLGGGATPSLAKLNINTPTTGLNPGIERLRSRPSDMYSPLPSQPWPDSQAATTPVTSAVKRKRGGDIDDMPTPETPYGSHLGPDPSPATKKYYKSRLAATARVAEIFRSDTERIEREKRLEERWKANEAASRDEEEKAAKRARRANYFTEENYKHIELKSDPRTPDTKMREEYKKQGKDWDKIGEIVANKHRALLREMDVDAKCMEVEDDDAVDKEEGGKVLSGVTVYVAKKLEQLNTELRQIVIELGGSVCTDFSGNFTHFIFQGKNRDLTKEFRQAQEAGKLIVSPDWVYMCRSEHRRVEESAFPHTYNPKTTISLSDTQSSVAKSRPRSRLTKLPQPTFNEDDSEDQVGEEGDKDEPFNKEDRHKTKAVEEPAAIPPSDKKTKRKEGLKAFESLVESLKNTPSVSLSSTTKHKPMKLDMSEEAVSVSTPTAKVDAVKESQVVWVDPVEEKNREELAMKINAETQDIGSINFSENMTEAMEMTEFKVFLITTGIDEKEVGDACRSLGGEMKKCEQFDPSCTHLITPKVTRSERMLGAIASGLWILHPSYVTDSLKAGYWLQESKYEWGNPEPQFIDLTSGEISAKLAIAGKRRRLARERGEEKIFGGIQAHLVMPEKKVGPFKRLIEAGGGKVVDNLTNSILTSLTHLFTESRYFEELNQSRLSSLVDMCIPVIKPLYLNDFLVSNDKRPNVDRYIVDEYRNMWESKKRSRITTDTPTSLGKKPRI